MANPEASFVTAPLPEMALLSVSDPVRLMVKVPLLTMLPAASDPVAPPLPSSSVPALMVVVPV